MSGEEFKPNDSVESAAEKVPEVEAEAALHPESVGPVSVENSIADISEAAEIRERLYAQASAEAVSAEPDLGFGEAHKERQGKTLFESLSVEQVNLGGGRDKTNLLMAHGGNYEQAVTAGLREEALRDEDRAQKLRIGGAAVSAGGFLGFLGGTAGIISTPAALTAAGVTATGLGLLAASGGFALASAGYLGLKAWQRRKRTRHQQEFARIYGHQPR